MQVKTKIINNEEEYFSQKLERKKTFIEKVRSGNRPYPKDPQQLLSINDILTDLEYPLKAYPEAAIQAAISRREEVTPLLLKILEDALDIHEDKELPPIASLFALYLLSQFREKQAFPFIIELARLPEETLDYLIGDCLTETLPQFIGSTYDGNLEAIKTLIEDPEVCVWSRSAALHSLSILFKEDILERDYILSYIKALFHHTSFIDDQDAMATLISFACDFYPDEVYAEIKEAYQMDRVDTTWIDLKDVDRVIQRGKEGTMKRSIYENPHCDIITDVIKETNWWAYCAQEPKKEVEWGEESFFDNVSITFQRETPKIGRNDPCACGSGKKYKKCCLKHPAFTQ